jgi:hypothetical protein
MALRNNKLLHIMKPSMEKRYKNIWTVQDGMKAKILLLTRKPFMEKGIKLMTVQDGMKVKILLLTRKPFMEKGIKLMTVQDGMKSEDSPAHEEAIYGKRYKNL